MTNQTPPELLEKLFNLEKTTGSQRDNSLYLQFYRQLRDAILQGRIRENTKLWSPRTVKETLGISRNTVINAYDKLFEDQLIKRQARRGYFVTDMRFSKLSVRGREISTALKDIVVPSDPIPFSTSLPNVLDEQTYKIWNRIVKHHWKETFSLPSSTAERMEARRRLGYSDPQGFYELRKIIQEYLNAHRGVYCEPDQIIITNGSQQCFDLIARMTLDSGDWVWFEQPGYHGARYCMEAAGAKLQPIPVDEDGFNFDSLTPTEYKHTPKLIYVTPSCHFPTGVVMPLARRMKLLEYAHTHKALIIEDDHNPYLYVGEPGDSIQKLENEYYGTARTFYVGSVTKTLFPGLRLGYMVVPKDLLKPFIATKSSMDIHHAAVGQASVGHFIAKHFPQHIKRMQASYINKQTVLVENILEKVNEHINFMGKEKQFEDKGYQYKIAADAGIGVTTYATKSALKRGFNDEEFTEYLMSEQRGTKKVKAKPLSSFYIDKTVAKQGLVLGFAGFDDAEIIEGVAHLQDHFESYFANRSKN